VDIVSIAGFVRFVRFDRSLVHYWRN